LPILVVPERVVRRSITPAECVEAVRAGFTQLAAMSTPAVDARFTYAGNSAAVNLYGAFVPGKGLGAKVLGAFETNPDRGEPYIHAVVTLHDPETGALEAVLDGGYLTALRTAAAVAVAARALGRPGSSVLGLLGTGLQARTHLLCHLAACPFEKVVVWGRNPDKVKTYLAEMQPQVEVPVEGVGSREAVCREADVVAATTRARTPLFSAGAFRAGTHIGVAGPLRQDESEIPPDLLRPTGQALLFVDARAKFEELWDPGEAPVVEGEIGDVLVGKTPGRVDGKAVTVFKPVGMAFEDVVSARIVIDRVRSEGTGHLVEWS